MASVFEVPDEVWEEVEPAVPAVEAKAHRTPTGGRPGGLRRDRLRARYGDRLASRAPRARLLGRDGVTAWRRLRDCAAGVWERLHGRCLSR